jgi:hypothetical protein
MNPTTSLEFSRKVFEIIGDQEMQYAHVIPKDKHFGVFDGILDVSSWEDDDREGWEEVIPAYTFGELLRVIPLIAEKNRLSDPHRYDVMMNASRCYMFASTPEQGMKDVETYLEQYL